MKSVHLRTLLWSISIVVWAAGGCSSARTESFAGCEGAAAVYYRADGVEIVRVSCASPDEPAVMYCRSGFVWRHVCTAGQRCLEAVQGDILVARCE